MLSTFNTCHKTNAILLFTRFLFLVSKFFLKYLEMCVIDETFPFNLTDTSNTSNK